MVHLINWSPVRKTPQHPEVHEDPVALTDVRVRLHVPAQPVKVTTVVSGQELPYHLTPGGIEVTVPRVLVHEIICYELRV
jgi:hypothetical protein